MHFSIRGLGFNPLSAHAEAPLDLLALTLRGIRKSQIVSKTTRLPISFEMLSNFCLLLDNGMFEPYTSGMLKPAATLAFFGLLCCGEFTSCAKLLDAALSRIDLTFFRQDSCLGLSVNIKASKMDPFRSGCIFLNLSNL